MESLPYHGGGNAFPCLIFSWISFW